VPSFLAGVRQVRQLLVDTPNSPGELGVLTSMKLSMPTRCAPTCDACAKMIEGILDSEMK